MEAAGGMRPTHVVARFAVRAVQSAGVFILVCVSWIFFRAQSFSDAWVILARVVHAHDFTTRNITGEFQVFKGLLLIAVVIVGDLVWSNVHLDEQLRRRWWLGGAFCGLSLLFLLVFGTFQGNSFIYFQF
jgi:hypothetical protein